ncbi:MAG: tetratricopeptide repeat protein [Chloroflexi bacterium]|nr:tetratricopeptide repeat protein [Chloroflexota bacterium]
MDQNRIGTTDTVTLADLLPMYLAEVGWSERQLAQRANIPRGTVRNWCKGAVTRPRQWRRLAQAAAAMRLDAEQTNALLRAAGHVPLAELQAQAKTEEDRQLLSFWRTAYGGAATFQAIPDLPYFVGRARELADLKKRLLQERHQTIYVLSGMAGVGKTTLAAHVAYEMRGFFTDGVLWASVDGSDTMTLLKLLADAYGQDVSHYVDLHSRSQAVRGILAHKRALLIIDNVENSQQVQPLLPPNGPCAVLITTRHTNLRVARGSPLFRIRPFNRQARYSADLFTKILGTKTVTAEKKALTEIADLLGHLPMALAIIAGRIAYEPHATVRRYLAWLKQEKARLDALKHENQSVQASFNASYTALSEQQQQFFAALGSFAGEGFSLEAAATINQVSELEGHENLVQLYNLSLVQASRNERYQLHPLLREYARAKITDVSVYQRMVTHFAEYVKENRDHFRALEEEMDNIVAALDLAYEQGMRGTAVALTIDFSRFLTASGLKELAASQLQRAKTAAKDLNDVASQALILCALGHIEKDDDWEKARARLKQALMLARAGKDDQIIALTLKEIGQIHFTRGDSRQAETYWQESLHITRQTQQKKLLGLLLNNLAAIALERTGDYRQAENLFLEGLALQREDKNLPALSLQLINLSMVAFSLGAYDQSETYLGECAALVEQIGYRWISSLLTRRRAELLIACQGNYTQARFSLQHGERIARELQHKAALGFVLTGLGKVTARLGGYNEAIVYLEEALQLAEETRRPDIEIEALTYLGFVAAQRSQHEKFEIYFHKALSLARSKNDVWYLSKVLRAYGECQLAARQFDLAQSAFNELLTISQKSAFLEHVGAAQFGLAQASLAFGDAVESKRLGEESLTTFQAIGHHQAKIVGEWLDSK